MTAPNTTTSRPLVVERVQAARQLGGQPHEPAGEHRVFDRGVAVGHAADVEPLVAPQRDDVGVTHVRVLLASPTQLPFAHGDFCA